MTKWTDVAVVSCGAMLALLLIYGICKVATRLSYIWWYRDMVEQAVHEILIEEGLLEPGTPGKPVEVPE